MEQVCLNCKHFAGFDGKGKCWRYPPQVTGDSYHGIRSVRPNVSGRDTCGEFKGKE